MATVNSKKIVDEIIAGNGIYPGDEWSPPCVKIVEYHCIYHDEPCYGLIYEGHNLNAYEESPFVRNPQTIWERKE